MLFYVLASPGRYFRARRRAQRMLAEYGSEAKIRCQKAIDSDSLLARQATFMKLVIFHLDRLEARRAAP